MKVLCVHDRILESMNYKVVGYSSATNFKLTVGSLYTVYAVMIENENVYYLLVVQDKDYPSVPYWYPAILFNVVESDTGLNWHYMCHVSDSHNMPLSMFGYRELVENPDECSDLMERVPDAVRRFWAWKAKVDRVVVQM